MFDTMDYYSTRFEPLKMELNDSEEWRSLDVVIDLDNTPSEDIWRKFDCVPPKYNSVEDTLRDMDIECASSSCHFSREIRYHDCMWSGTCGSAEHKVANRTGNSTLSTTSASVNSSSEQSKVTGLTSCSGSTSSSSNSSNSAENKTSSAVSNPTTPPQSKRTGVIVQRTVGRSLLANRANSQKVVASPTVQVKSEPRPDPERPETPQSLDEDEDDINDDDRWETSKGVSVSEVTNQVRRTAPPQPVKSTTVQFDHNYDKSQNSVRPEDLGLQTPSDSEEEEIDVVSVSMRSAPAAASAQLPTNPTRAVRNQLQSKVASLASGKILSEASQAVSRRLKSSTRSKRKDDDDDDDDEPQPKKRPRKYYHRRHYYHHHHHQANHTTTVRSPKKNNRFSTDSETDTTEKRSLHNNMERMRRIDLRNAFDDLRTLVPCLADSNRAAKVTILKDAANYCYELGKKENSMCSTIANLKKDQERLKARLSKLRRTLAARR